MLLQCLSALCNPPGGPGSIRKYLEALLKAIGVFWRFACGFHTDLHFADGMGKGKVLIYTPEGETAHRAVEMLQGARKMTHRELTRTGIFRADRHVNFQC
jgi:hypothetical protein